MIDRVVDRRDMREEIGTILRLLLNLPPVVRGALPAPEAEAEEEEAPALPAPETAEGRA
jgi:acetyl-CoA carboxylase carboxyl transferase subunit beta